MVHYFKNASPDELKRPSGPVDVLIGYRYAGYHPEPEQKSDHLLLLKNRFGQCLGGTHAAFGEADHTMHNARVHRPRVRDQDRRLFHYRKLWRRVHALSWRVKMGQMSVRRGTLQAEGGKGAAD